MSSDKATLFLGDLFHAEEDRCNSVGSYADYVPFCSYVCLRHCFLGWRHSVHACFTDACLLQSSLRVTVCPLDRIGGGLALHCTLYICVAVG